LANSINHKKHCFKARTAQHKKPVKQFELQNSVKK